MSQRYQHQQPVQHSSFDTAPHTNMLHFYCIAVLLLTIVSVVGLLSVSGIASAVAALAGGLLLIRLLRCAATALQYLSDVRTILFDIRNQFAFSNNQSVISSDIAAEARDLLSTIQPRH